VNFEELDGLMALRPSAVLSYLKKELSQKGSGFETKGLNLRLLAYVASRMGGEAKLERKARVYTEIAVLSGEILALHSSSLDPRADPMMVRTNYVKRFPRTALARRYLVDINNHVNNHLKKCRLALAELEERSWKQRSLDEICALRVLKNCLNGVSLLFGSQLLSREDILVDLWKRRRLLP
jgi:hypothetical protein